MSAKNALTGTLAWLSPPKRPEMKGTRPLDGVLIELRLLMAAVRRLSIVVRDVCTSLTLTALMSTESDVVSKPRGAVWNVSGLGGGRDVRQTHDVGLEFTEDGNHLIGRRLRRE